MPDTPVDVYVHETHRFLNGHTTIRSLYRRTDGVYFQDEHYYGVTDSPEAAAEVFARYLARCQKVGLTTEVVPAAVWMQHKRTLFEQAVRANTMIRSWEEFWTYIKADDAVFALVMYLDDEYDSPEKAFEDKTQVHWTVFSGRMAANTLRTQDEIADFQKKIENGWVWTTVKRDTKVEMMP